MAIEVTCVCGNRLKGKRQWAGSRAKCPFCGSVVTFPAEGDDPSGPSGGISDLLDEEIASSVAGPAARPPAATEPANTTPVRKTGFFARLWRKLSPYGAIAFRWREPAMYRLRLRGDIPIRLVVVGGVWAAMSGVMLVAVGVNNNPPHPLAAVFLGAVFGLGPAALFAFMGRDHVSGDITVAEREIHRHRDFVSALVARGWHEWSKWPYEAIRRSTIVPAEALGKSFSVAILEFDSKTEVVGIRKSINLKDFSRHMAAQGVTVEQGQAVPAEFTRPMGVPFAAVFAAVGAVSFLAGMAFYVDRVGGLVPQVAQADDAKPDRFDEIEQNLPGGMPERIAPDLNDDVRIRPGDVHNPLPRADERDQDAASRPAEPQADEADDWPGRSSLPRRFPREGLFPGYEPETPPTPPSIPARMSRTPPSHRPPAAPLEPGDTELAGGTGGAPFRSVDSEGRPVVGFRYSLGSWAGEPALRTLEPLYDRAPPAGREEQVLARDGYAVAGLNVRTAQFVTGVQVVFMAVAADGKLDPGDSYTSDWIGETAGGETTSLGGKGAKAIGVHGRRAAVLDAVGLVTETR